MADKTPADMLKAIDHAKRFALPDFEALGIKDTPNGPLFPAHIRVRKADGSLESKPCWLMLLGNRYKFKIKKHAKEWLKDVGYDNPADPEYAALRDELEEYEKFAYAIRDRDPDHPDIHDQTYPRGKDLFEAFKSLGSLAEIKGQYEVFEALHDPRYGELNETECWGVIAACAKEGTLHPLMLIGGLEQVSCILLSAHAALTSPRAPSSVRRPMISGLVPSESPE